MTKYQKRIPGPMLDRIHIDVEVPRVDYEKLSSDRLGEPMASIRDWVQTARERQGTRFDGTEIVSNSDMRGREMRQLCKLDETGENLMRSAISKLQLSARGYHRVSRMMGQ